METIRRQVITEAAFQLLARTATSYPKNFLNKLIQGLHNEEQLGPKSVIVSIVENILAAAEGSVSLCQDTGVPVFQVYLNPGVVIEGDLQEALTEATVRATEEVPIRRNVIDPLTFQNPGTNTGWGAPFIYYHYSPQPGPLRIRAELKGFGGEIKSTADWVFTSSNNMENAVLAYVLNNVLLSKGEGCVPGFLGIGLGGYLDESMASAKNAVFRELSGPAPQEGGEQSRELRRIEQRILRCVNRLGLGPMGSGGKTASLGVYLEKRGAHTAVAPISVSQQCWASRGSEALISEAGTTFLTPYVKPEEAPQIREQLAGFLANSQSQGTAHVLNLPVEDSELLKLRTWDVVYLNGTVCTSRDGAHRRMLNRLKEGKRDEIPGEILQNCAIYHCGPVVARQQEGWQIEVAGPTTSSRFTSDGADLTEQGIIKIAIGKGTMGEKMKQALKGRGVYLKAVGGCAVSYREMIKRSRVEWLDLGYPEAVWVLEVENFGPLIVGIDSTGESLTDQVMNEVYHNARSIYQDEGLDPGKRYVQYPQTFAGLSLEEVIEKAQSL